MIAPSKQLPPLQDDVDARAGCWLLYYIRDISMPLSSLVAPALVGPAPASVRKVVSGQGWQNETEAPPYISPRPLHRQPPGTVGRFSVLGTVRWGAILLRIIIIYGIRSKMVIKVCCL